MVPIGGEMEFRTIGIVGGGLMGRSIARELAADGRDAIVLELSEARVRECREALEADLDLELQKWGITETDKRIALRRIRFVASVEELSEVDLVIESIPDLMESKRRVMRELDGVLPKDRVIITNTETLSISEIGQASGRPDKVVGMHFLYPVAQTELVEVVRGIDTSDETFGVARHFADLLGKTIIEVFEYPGYVTTRAIVPLLNEAMYIVMEGVARAEDVDLALRHGFEMRVGPLEYADTIGLDRLMASMDHLFHELGEMKYRPCPLLRKLVRAGRLGKKSGRGFFVYDGDGNRVESGGGAR